MTNLQPRINKVLLELQTNRILRSGKSSWKWENKRPRQPGLTSPVVTQLLESKLVEEKDDELILSTHGKSYIEVCLTKENK